MPTIDVVDPERVRALYLLWMDHPSKPTRMEIALKLCEIKELESYRQRQVASSRLSGALSGKEKVSRSRWSHWLYLATQAGIDAESLRDSPLPEDPRRNVWPLPSRAVRTGRTPKLKPTPEAAAAEGAS
jgi:hypothetical protein